MLYRATWLQEKRRLAEVRYDTLFASDYDQHYSHIGHAHRTYK